MGTKMTLIVAALAALLGGCGTTKNYYIYPKGSSPAAEMVKQRAAESDTRFVWYRDDKGNLACTVFGVKVEDEKKCNEILEDYRRLAAGAQVPVSGAFPVYSSYAAAPAYVRTADPFLQTMCGVVGGTAGYNLIGGGRGRYAWGLVGFIAGMALCSGTGTYAAGGGYGYGGYYGGGSAFAPPYWTPLQAETLRAQTRAQMQQDAFRACSMATGDPYSRACQNIQY